MAKRVFDWNVQRFTNVNGATNSNPTFVPFDLGSYGTTNSIRFDLEVSCIALQSTDHGNTYPAYYCARVIYTWDPGSSGTGVINATLNLTNQGATDLTFTTDSGGSLGGRLGQYRVQMHAFNTSAWTVVCAAKILNFAEY